MCVGGTSTGLWLDLVGRGLIEKLGVFLDPEKEGRRTSFQRALLGLTSRRR